MKLKSVLAATTLLAVISAPVMAADINLKMTNVKSDDGQLVIRVFNDSQADAFPGGEPLREEKIPSSKGEVTYTLKDLPEGTYAIGVYQDQNSNNDLDKNFIGAPKEPTANTGKKVMLKPNFKDSSFAVSGDSVDVEAQF